jgi:succinate dehydrogenase/fumarate reductase cytochrome b subunit
MKKFLSTCSQKVRTYVVLSLFALLLSPAVALAQQANKDSVQGYLVLIGLFINNTILPFIFALALLFFMVNAARYFIFGGANEDGQDKARRMALYGIGAFVFLVSIWGIVNTLVSGLGIQNRNVICPDYLGTWGCRYSGNGGWDSPRENNWEPVFPDGSLDNEIPRPSRAPR